MQKASNMVKNHSSIKLSVKHTTRLILIGLMASTFVLSGCGFKLRGYEQNQSLFAAVNQSVVIKTENNRTAYAVKNPLEQKLQTLGVSTLPQEFAKDDTSTIQIEDIEFKQYELLGVLTEIRLIISAKVSYQIQTNGDARTVQDTIQVERSYQFNEASIGIENQQNKQAKQWLYDALAQRIADQYLALTAR